MPFVITQPEALTAAATRLQGIGSGVAAQNAAAAAPTTGVIPAAADEVSALQATQFAAYGTLYQAVSAQASAIHEMFVHTLGISADSYGATEAANAAAAGSSGSGLSGILGFFTNNGQFGLLPSAASNSAIVGAMQAGNFGSGASDLLFLAQGTLTGPEASGVEAVASSGVGAPTAGAVGSMTPAGVGAAPVLAAVGRASSIGGLSVPPSWAGEAVPAASAAPVTVAGAGWTTPAPQGTPVATMPAGMPSMASAERGCFGFGTPRYGVKPTVMPKPAVV
uniref:PE family protein n=1 Tax=Mycobacterium riyadhense TaxID=486698 RepID=A0A653F0N8_9MYCO|nr:PE family protein [Mycobacterium riyadhense]